METEISKYIYDRLRSVRGRLGVYYENLVTGESFEVICDDADGSVYGKQYSVESADDFVYDDGHGKDDIFESASVIKLWIMSEAYRQAEAGFIKLDDRIAVRKEDMVPSSGMPDYNRDRLKGELTEDMFPESGLLNYLHPGLELTIRDLIRSMILISDNTATNVLIDVLGMDNINNHIRSLRAKGTKLNRKLFDVRPESAGKENIISLRETGDFLRRIYHGELVSEEADGEMLAILQNQQNTYKIPFYIRRYPVAHKTGEDSGIENDVGIVFTDRPFILCLASNNADEPEAVRLWQELARELTDYTNYGSIGESQG